jgi:hypothetical protein
MCELACRVLLSNVQATLIGDSALNKKLPTNKVIENAATQGEI